MARQLFLYTIDFPYGNTEPYLANELPFLCSKFSEITIVAENKGNSSFDLPPNVNVYFLSELSAGISKQKLIFKNCFLLLGIFLDEFFKCDNRSFFLKRWKLTASELIQALVSSAKINKLSGSKSQSAVHYSFWMNSFPLALSILKKKNNISGFVFRVHGFDLYKERWPGNFIPYRHTNYKYASAIFVVSEMGLKYIQTNFDFSDKAKLAYLGTADHGANPFDPGQYTIVTCSSIIPLKRLGLLCEALQSIPINITWHHFGDGKEADKTNFITILQKLPKNIKYVLHGQVAQDHLFHFYKTIPVSVFINVSSTEGLPVSIMEAISFGIPVIATNVGGTCEIVKPSTGVLVPATVTATELSQKILDVISGEQNTAGFRKKTRQFWNENFSAKENYTRFSNVLLSV